MGPEHPHSSLESIAEETPVVQGDGTTPWHAPPSPGSEPVASGTHSAQGWPFHLSTCPQ